MNGDDPQRYERTRRVPQPFGNPGAPSMPPRREPAPGHREPQPPPPGHDPGRVERTKVIRHDGSNYAPPLAYSQVPPDPAASRMPPPARRPAPSHAPTQQPYREARGVPGYAPPQQPQPYQDPRQLRHGRDIPPPPPPSLPPSRREREPRPPRRRRKPHLFRWFLVLLVVLVLAVVGAVVKLDGSLNRIDALANYKDRVGDTPGTNWLLVGSDGRAGLTPEQEQELATGGEVGPERTDTIMLVHVPESGATTLVSLPRDSYVGIPGHGKDKLNAAFAFGGAQLLVQTVEIATGVRIDHYAQIGFGGFAGVVDTLGGIDVCVPKAIDDPLAGIDLQPGCQKLDGAQALGFVRSRATALADLDRMNNQRLFMAALLKKATSAGTLANPFTLWPLARDTAKSLKVDKGDHIWNLGQLGWALRGDTVATTVPVGGFTDTDSGNVLLWDKERAGRLFDDLAKDQPIPDDLLTR
ncbi:LCP family protein [Nocardia sp. NBC_00565]|uniref:LCP family protein n=1 Tax=Nocardia sp. NBC_00565 TaxID=2975993 RepID=UPI002E803CE3|nr:LCP family protein [Nocardia sp. NBC_00565]WUC01947.1 LCP family protein [Nocardia sp. NBC_00565]